VILENLVLVVGLILTGTAMRKSGWFPQNTSDVLNTFVLNVSLPAIIMISIPSLPLDERALYPVAIHWVAFPLHIAAVVLLQKIFKFRKSVFASMLIVTTLGNTAFLGIPMVKTFYGESAIPFAVLYDQLGSGLGFIIFGAFVLPMFSDRSKQSLADVFKHLITFPAFIALILGFVFKFYPLPGVFNNFLSQLAATLIPCAMVAVGFQMKYKLEIHELRPLAAGLLLKLLVLPFIVLGIVKLFSIETFSANVSILQAGMPPMVTAGAMAIEAGLEKDLSAAYVGYGLIFAFATLPLIHSLI